ncbi:strawberry notch C-terminal domain-containing protein [Acerihabitans sp. TG2]|uniref:strawberry notch C-terminal domain-containing protein n=1 Tax=Acerihabitans sp. TG2 TaxID=3096008 RepID=UPI002B23C6D5|nr:strawberry notch C-terminal domain-containing protein [Acerihabitans sp. TG2]MEA9392206.1 strawberry notch C-terminal domain-containing protein [Acerihabitans sp. TG2]
MAINDENMREAIIYLQKAENKINGDVKPQGLKDYSYNAYLSKRPLWVGFYDRLRQSNISIHPDEGLRDPSLVLTVEPISFSLQQELEISPVNTSAKLMLAREMFSDKVLVLYNLKTSTAKVMWQIGENIESFSVENSGVSHKITDVRGFNDAADWMVHNAVFAGFIRHASINPRISKFVGDEVANAVMFALLLNKIGIDDLQMPFEKILNENKNNINNFIEKQFEFSPVKAEQIVNFWQSTKKAYSLDQKTFDFPFKLMNEFGDYCQDIIETKKLELGRNLAQQNASKSLPTDMIQWLDLDSFNIYLGEQRFSDGVSRLMLVDLDDYIGEQDIKEQLAEIGFRTIPGQLRQDGGIYYLAKKEQALKPSVLAAALKMQKIPLKTVLRDDVPRLFRNKIFERFELNINRYTLDNQVIGVNHTGDTVFDSPFGRFIRDSKSSVTVENSGGASIKQSLFLRAISNQDLAECSEAFVARVAMGQRANYNDFLKFGRLIFDVEEVSSLQLHQLQESIEAAAYRYYSVHSAGISDAEAFTLGQNIYFGLPSARQRTAESVSLQQYSTPLPMSLVCQLLLIGKDTISTDATVLEPTGGNGGLLTRLPSVLKKQIVELDEKRVATLRLAFPDAAIMHEDATRLNFNRVFGNGGGVDYVISNPPFGQMEQPERFDLLPKVRRLDYFIALRALASRKNEGRAVIIVGADEARSDGTVKGSAKSVLTYINDLYQVEGAVEVDGRLYARAGSAYNVRIIVVGDKRPYPVEAPVIEKLPVIDSYQGLWDWSQTLIDSYKKGADLIVEKVIEPVAEPVSKIRSVPNPTVTNKEPVVKAPRSRLPKNVAATVTTADVVSEPPAIFQEPSVKAVLEKPVLRNVNEYQAPYQTASRVGQPSTMIPINMSAATYRALSKIQDCHDDIDDFVSQRLQYTADELPRYFSPEQVDALALAITRVEDGLGIINADQTGIGKGRFVAGLLRYAKLNDKMPVFMSIKPELFTDIFRDITDINSQHLFKKPFIFNTGVDVKVYGTADTVLYPATPANELNQALASGKLPDGVDLVMTTYSQFARARNVNKKSGLILDVINENSMLFLDESHVAAGESQISSIISDCVGKSGGVVYSSATPIKGVKNFRLYSKCFPPSVDTVNLADVLAVGGEDLQEAISTNMALDGAIIRREHDFSKLTFDTLYPSDEMVDKNRELMNYVADILADMSYLSGDVNKIVNTMNREEDESWENIPEALRTGNRMNASSMNFSSRLYNITRQFLLAVKTESAIQASLTAINNGQKPVIAVENTGESLLRAMIAISSGTDFLEDELDQLDNKGELSGEEEQRRYEITKQISSATASVIFDQPPQFSDLLEVMLERLAKITVRGRYGEVNTERADNDPEYLEKQESVREKIHAFPYSLPLTPIDEIKHTMARHGYKFAEVSGRTVSLVPRVADGVTRWGVSFHKKADAVSAVAGFQNGTYDGVVITRSGSTGISLHATKRFADSDARQRNFIVLQKAANIADFLQWMGRVNRKDQVVHPVITNVESGLPAETRQTMMHNSKLRKLSANTTSNRENENLEGDEDLLNRVGDNVALAYLRENPDVADALDIKMPKKGDELAHMSENPYINKLMGRLMMISVEQQEKILREVGDRYNETIEMLEQEGKNPFKIDVHDWKASVVSSEELISGNIQASDSSFDAPVKLVKVEYKKFIEPIRFAWLDGLMARNISTIFADEDGSVDMPKRLNKFKDVLSLMQKNFVYEHLPVRVLNKKPSLLEIRNMDKGVDGAKTALEKSDYLLSTLTSLKIGKHIKLFDKDTEEETYGVIAEIHFPNNDDGLFTLSKYRLKLAFAGKDELVEKSLAALRGMDAEFSTHLPDFMPGKAIEEYPPILRDRVSKRIQEFDIAPKGEMTLVRNLLEGNIYRACEMAATEGVGYPILYTDADGNRKRAVNIKAAITPDEIKHMPIAFTAKDAIQYVREHRSNLQRPGLSKKIEFFNTNRREQDSDEGIRIVILNHIDDVNVFVKGTKQANNGLITNGRIFDIGEKTPSESLGIKLSGNRNSMTCTFDIVILDEFMERLVSGAHISKFYISEHHADILQDLKSKNQIAKEFRNNTTIDMKMTG